MSLNSGLTSGQPGFNINTEPALALITVAPYILLSAAIFFVNHYYSYTYYKNKPKKKQNIGTIMFYPYARIVPMHLMIAGAFYLAGEGQTGAVALFLILKTGADAVMHYIEHREQWV